jgi:Ca-activated chloride channel family protein
VVLALLPLLAGCSGGGAGDGSSQQQGQPSVEGGAPARGPDAGTLPRQGVASTFALDVDTASYGFARRALLDGRLPDPATIRPEEFVNALDQDYPQPEGDGFSMTVDGARIPGSPEGAARVLRVGLQTRAAAAGRGAAALTFVVDVSGSMAEPGRLDLVKDALHFLVDQLGPADSVAIVAYSDEARVLQPMTRVDESASLHAAVDRLSPEASTNLEGGLLLGYRTAREGFREGLTNRVILLSDGLANVGNTAADPILARVREEAGKGIALLCVGVGSQYGDQLMEQLADKGDGFAVYTSEREQARRLFVDKLPQTLELRAVDAKAQVIFDTETVASYRLVGFENRAVAPEQFRDDSVDGGEIGPGHSVTALYEVVLRPGAGGQVALATVRWLDPTSRAPAETSRAVTVEDLSRELWTDAPSRLQVDVLAARFAETLRRGAGTDLSSLDALASEGDRLARLTNAADIAELATMVGRAAALT